MIRIDWYKDFHVLLFDKMTSYSLEKKRQEHHIPLQQVLQKKELIGVKLKREKCIFMADEVMYLRHRTNKQGIKPTEEKVQAIKDFTETDQR